MYNKKSSVVCRSALAVVGSIMTLMAAAEPVAGKCVYLDEIDVSRIETGWGNAKANKSVDGRPLTVGGVTFKKGVGVHAISSALYSVKDAVSFSAKVGIDDETLGNGSVKFIVYADGKSVAETDFLKGRTAPVEIKADLTGSKEVELFVCDALDGITWDHADWCDAKFELKEGGSVDAADGIGGEELGILTPAPSKAPRINGARVYGVRPGRPILWRAAVTGERPMEFSVSKLPEGLEFDASTGVFSGAIEKKGDYDVVLTAKNAAGKAERKLTFKVGDKIALTPPMGWNSWNCFAHTVNEKNIRDTADILVSSGLADHGWTYVNIDDFWQNKLGEKKDATLIGPARNPDGTIVSNKRFPDMKGLADYVHSKGLKIGLYSSPGPYTCGGCVGSWMHEWQDAKTYADWGYDYLKYDWCGYSKTVMGDGLGRAMYPYQVMGEALAAQNRDIVHSLCQYGMEKVSTWGEKCGQCWRTTGDINDSWGSVSSILRAQRDLWPFAGPGAWNDPDMLVVGSLGWGNLHPTKLKPNEQYTHVSMWAMLCSPLLIGCDLTKLDDFTKALLTNDEVIDVSQDELGAQAARVQWGEANGEVWAKPMSDGSFVLALFNPGRRKAIVSADLVRLGLVGEWLVRDLWRQADEGLFSAAYSSEMPAHCTKLVRLFPRNGAGLKPCMRDIRNASFYSQFETKRPLGKPGYGTSAPCGDCPKNRAVR